jgi:hypothetical protein
MENKISNSLLYFSDVFGGNEAKIMEMLDAIRTWADEKGHEQIDALRIQPGSQNGRKSPRVGTGGTFGEEDEIEKNRLRMIDSDEDEI